MSTRTHAGTKCVVCFTEAKLRCSKCGIEPYCGVEHQTMVYYTHKHVCEFAQMNLLAQPTFTKEEMHFISLDKINNEIRISFAFDIYSPEEYAVKSVETIRILKELDYDLRTINLFKPRIYAGARGGVFLVEQVLERYRYLRPFYSIAAVMSEVNDMCITAKSWIYIHGLFRFYSIMHSPKLDDKVDKEKKRILLQGAITDVTSAVELRITNPAGYEEVIVFFAKKLSQIGLEEKLWYFNATLKDSPESLVKQDYLDRELWKQKLARCVAYDVGGRDRRVYE